MSMSPEEFIDIIKRESSSVMVDDSTAMSRLVEIIRYYLNTHKGLSSSPEVISFLEELSENSGIKIKISESKIEAHSKRVESSTDRKEEKANAKMFRDMLSLKEVEIDEIREIEFFSENYKEKRIDFSELSKAEGFIVFSILNTYVSGENKDALEEDFQCILDA